MQTSIAQTLAIVVRLVVPSGIFRPRVPGTGPTTGVLT